MTTFELTSHEGISAPLCSTAGRGSAPCAAKYIIWKENPGHPGLQFKQVHLRQPIYSVRVGIGWRALGLRQKDVIVWFWIGSHSDYGALLKRL